jgi:hypothetical protein
VNEKALAHWGPLRTGNYVNYI